MNIRHSLLALLTFAISASFCSAQDSDDSARIVSAIKKECFTIDVRTIYPQAGMPIHDSGYSLKLCGGKVTANLPFYGTSDTAVYGGEDSSINLDGCPVKIKKKKDKDVYVLSFSAESGNNRWEIEISAWDSGSCEIYCRCSTKSPMRYIGDLIP